MTKDIISAGLRSLQPPRNTCLFSPVRKRRAYLTTDSGEKDKLDRVTFAILCNRPCKYKMCFFFKFEIISLLSLYVKSG